MSSGAKVVSHYAKQTDPKVAPATGWKVLPYVSNGMTNTNEMAESETVVDSRIKGAGMVVSGTVSGDIETELMWGTYDDLIAGAFFSDWTGGADPQLTVGSVKHQFAVTKDFTDIGVFHAFLGCIVNSFNLNISTDGLVKATFGLMGMGYDQSTEQSFAKDPAPAALGMKASGGSIGTILVDGEDIGVCVEAFEFSIDNQAEVQKCLGDNIYGGNVLAMLAAISGSMTLAYSKKAHNILELQRTGATMSLVIPIEFGDNEYTLTLPKIQISGDVPEASGSGLVKAEVSYTVVEESPILVKNIS